MSRLSEIFPKILFVVSVMVSSFAYGIYAHKYHLFPLPQLSGAIQNLGGILSPMERIIYSETNEKDTAITYMPNRIGDGLILVMGVADNNKNMIRVIDRAGNVIYELRPDWFEIWGEDEGGFPEYRRPQTQPGALLHGIGLLQNGDMVVNFEHLSTMRMNWCGDVIWKLDNLGHHSVDVAEDGTIWVPMETYYDRNPTKYRNHYAPLRSWAIQHISSNGEVLEIIPVIDILRNNGFEGLLYLSTLNNFNTGVSGDTLHLNDVEVFPTGFTSDVFEAGDVMFSLRNINSIFVMNPKTKEIKFSSIGEVLRQHDPDFMDNDAISIFDNHNLLPSGEMKGQSSRIVEIDVRTGKKSVIVGESDKTHFFTDIMGAHQWLPNGDILIVSSRQGRVIETLSDGALVWSYTNKVRGTKVGIVTSAMLLPQYMDVKFFQKQMERCR